MASKLKVRYAYDKLDRLYDTLAVTLSEDLSAARGAMLADLGEVLDILQAEGLN